MSHTPHLVLFDADNIAGYVFDSGRLKEIRGGSLLVRESTKVDVVVRLAHACDSAAEVIYAAGGAGLVRFPSPATAKQFATLLQRHYRRQTVGGTLTAVASPYPGSFADAIQAAQIALRRRKSEFPQRDQQFSAGPYTAICVSCGRRPVQSD